MKPMTNEEFRERIKTICGARPKEDKPCVRKPTDRGYYPPTCQHSTTLAGSCVKCGAYPYGKGAA